jgi:F420-dependent oxidoreductase-like protein
MRLGLMLGYSGSKIELPMDLVKLADQLGVYAVWTAEAWGSDAVTPLAWIGAQTKHVQLGTAIMQMPARTPANTAMTAMTLDQLSGGRFLLGLGVSGPQVVEGWHGVPYGKPLQRTREYVAIVRQVLARRGALEFDGKQYQIPYQGEDATGLGKPLKSILRGRKDLPIYLAAIGPKNVQLAAEIADGWLPIFFAPRHYARVFRDSVERGFAGAGNGKGYTGFDIAPTIQVVVGDDLEACRNAVKPKLALYVGGMGAKGKNFYYDLVCRYGYADAAEEIQTKFLGGEKMQAVMAVPDELVDEVALCGPRERIQDLLAEWKDCPITTLNVIVEDAVSLRTMVELVM